MPIDDLGVRQFGDQARPTAFSWLSAPRLLDEGFPVRPRQPSSRSQLEELSQKCQSVSEPALGEKTLG